MTFLSVLKTIGHVFVAVTPVVIAAEPEIALAPGGGIFNVVFNAVVNVEKIFTGVSSAGTIKKATASAIIAAGVPNLPPDRISIAIDEIVTGLNTLAAVEVGMGGIVSTKENQI